MSKRAPHILIVDDEVDTCENLSDIFSEMGYEVDMAYDGASALALVAENTYDIALLDLRMPGMDGLELYRRIKQVSAGTVAIVVTAHASSDMADSIMQAGAWSLISKPVNISRLLALVSEAVKSPLILVVDDDADLCENLWEIFREKGYRVHLAHNAREAERALNERSFQLILVDMKLPGGRGPNVLELIRDANQLAQTLVITGYPNEMESRVREALSSGAKAVCYKPFDVPALLTTIRGLLEKQSARTR